MARLKFSQNFLVQYVLFMNILKKHNAMGANSPLINNFDIASITVKADTANASNAQKEEYERLAEKETEIRNNEWEEVNTMIRNIGQFLKAKYNKTPHELGEWGFTVDDSTVVKPKKSST